MISLGGMFNCNVLALSYLYAQIEDRTHFKWATSVVTIGIQFGRSTGDALAQIIVNLSGQVYTILPYCNAFSNYQRQFRLWDYVI